MKILCNTSNYENWSSSQLLAQFYVTGNSAKFSIILGCSRSHLSLQDLSKNVYFYYINCIFPKLLFVFFYITHDT